MNYILDLVGAALILFGLYCIYRTKKRRFDRTNAFGVQQFPSYAGKVKDRLGDTILIGLAICAISAGTVAFAEAHRDPWGDLIYGLFFFWLFIGVFIIKPK